MKVALYQMLIIEEVHVNSVRYKPYRNWVGHAWTKDLAYYAYFIYTSQASEPCIKLFMGDKTNVNDLENAKLNSIVPHIVFIYVFDLI